MPFGAELASQLGKLQARSDGRSLGGDPDCGRAGFRVCPLGGEDPPQQGNRLLCAQRRKGYSGRTVPDRQAAELAAASDKDQAGLRVKVADHTKHGSPAVNIKVPIGVVKWGMKMARAFHRK